MTSEKYMNSVHTYGRIWTILTLCAFFAVPVSFCIYNNSWPELSTVLSGLAPIAILFYPVGVIEVMTYAPLIGAGGTYLSFVTGNISNLKLPCALSAMDSANVSAQSEEGELISTISIATSSIVTTLIIAAFVLLFTPILPTLTDPDSLFAPAFQQVVPALFGALGASYFSKHLKISIVPLVLMVIVLLISGKLTTGILIPISVIGSLIGTQIMYKKNML